MVRFFIVYNLFIITAFSQDSLELKFSNAFSYQNKELKNNFKTQKYHNVNNDTIWYFHPFSINLYSGICMPIGTLSNFYNPGLHLGASFGLTIARKIKVEYGLGAKFLNNINEIELIVNDSIVETNESSGASVGGLITYRIFKNKELYIDPLSGMTWEILDTGIENPNPDRKDSDSLLSISTIGFSFGMDTWINKFGKENVGIRFLYNYATYNRDNILNSSIGGHSITFSLIYRIPRRKDIFREYHYFAVVSDNKYKF